MSLANLTLSETALVLSVVTVMVLAAAVEVAVEQPSAITTPVIIPGPDVTTMNTVPAAALTSVPVQAMVLPTPVGPVVIGTNTAAIVMS